MHTESYNVYFNGPWDSEQVDYMIGGTYYQCGGGGPEWGYVVKGDFLWEVYRSWGEPWRIQRIKGYKAVYEDGEIRIENEPMVWERWDKTTLWDVPETINVVLPSLPPLPGKGEEEEEEEKIFYGPQLPQEERVRRLMSKLPQPVIQNESGRVQFGEYPTAETPPPSPPKVSINVPLAPDLRTIKPGGYNLYKKNKK